MLPIVVHSHRFINHELLSVLVPNIIYTVSIFRSYNVAHDVLHVISARSISHDLHKVALWPLART